jgi:hypothetical protein
MEKTITLNETQLKLLKEYGKADADFQETRKELAYLNHSEESLDACQKRYQFASACRDRAACVFASCVANCGVLP